MPETPALDTTAAEQREQARAEDPPAGKPESKAELTRRRDQRAAELRMAGYDYDQIARAIGYKTRSAAWKAVERVRSAALRETGSTLIALELDRLDQLQRAATTKALSGDARSIRAALAVMQQRARLLGLHEQRGEERIAEARDAFAVFLGAVRQQHPDPDPMVDETDDEEAAS